MQPDNFSHECGSVESSAKECLKILLRFVIPSVKIKNMCKVQDVVHVKSCAVKVLVPLTALPFSLQLSTCRHCGMEDPSWSELGHFVHFLNLQFLSCEDSVFCNEALVGDVMAGLKTFVVKFMIRMSMVKKLLRVKC